VSFIQVRLQETQSNGVVAYSNTFDILLHPFPLAYEVLPILVPAKDQSPLTVTIYGENFVTSETKVRINSLWERDVTVVSSTEGTFSLPMNKEAGIYEVEVTNSLKKWPLTQFKNLAL